LFPFIHIATLSIPARPLILLAAFWIAAGAAERAAKRLGLRGDDVYNLAFWGGLAFLLGARLGYVLQYWSAYQNDLGSIVALNFNTLSPIGGLIAAIAVAYGYARRTGIAHRKLLDALTPGFIVFAAALALADYASGDGYGSPSALAWSIELWGELRHPVQLYQLIAVLVIGLIVLRSHRSFDGAHFGLFAALYATFRLILEAFHGDSTTYAGVRVSQVWSFAALMVLLILLRRWALSAHTDTGEAA
jgi:phosphatidylglycerol:prolipoprotein diacylglycerol transferase